MVVLIVVETVLLLFIFFLEDFVSLLGDANFSIRFLLIYVELIPPALIGEFKLLLFVKLISLLSFRVTYFPTIGCCCKHFIKSKC